MNKMFKFAIAGVLVMGMIGCGTRVEVPPAHVGKIMTKDGYKEGIKGTSKFRLDACWAYCDKLVLINAGDQANTESMKIFIPEDKLNLEVDVRTNLTLNKEGADALFDALPPQDSENEDVAVIERTLAYRTYAQQIILTETREYLSQYSIAEIASSLEKVNSDLRIRLQKSLEARTPFSVRYVGITNIKYPSIITEAQENAAKRREQIQQEEAQLQISKVQLERELQEARLQRKIDVETALAAAEADRIRSAALTPAVIKMRELDNARHIGSLMFGENWDGAHPIFGYGGGMPGLGGNSLLDMSKFIPQKTSQK